MNFGNMAFGLPAQVGSTALSAYAVAGNEPETVADFQAEFYRKGGSGTTFGGLFTFGRSSSAAYEDSNGDLQTATSGNERVGYYRWTGAALEDKGLRLETDARTNVEQNSGNPNLGGTGMSNATWTSGANDPFNGTSAYALRGNTTSGNHFRTFDNSYSYTSGTRVVLSIWLKAAGSQRYVSIGFDGLSFPASERRIGLDLVNGTVTNQETNVKGYIQDFGGGYYRCAVSAVPNSTGTVATDYFIALRNTAGVGAESYAGSTSDGVDVFGFQVEVGSIPSSYIATSGSQVTRAAESLTAGSANLSFDGTAMWVTLEGEEIYADQGTANQKNLFDWRADANNRITLSLDTDGAKTGTLTLTVVNGGNSASVAATTELTPGLNKAFNIACRVTDSEINIALDGTAATAVSAPTGGVPGLGSADATFAGMGSRALFRQGTGDIADSGIETAST